MKNPPTKRRQQYFLGHQEGKLQYLNTQQNISLHQPFHRPVTCLSMSEWADHLLRFEDGRFAKDPDFKFIVQNMMRKMALESSTFVFNQKFGNKHLIVEDLKKKLQNWDTAVSKKNLYFSASLCGTSQ